MIKGTKETEGVPQRLWRRPRGPNTALETLTSEDIAGFEKTLSAIQIESSGILTDEATAIEAAVPPIEEFVEQREEYEARVDKLQEALRKQRSMSRRQFLRTAGKKGIPIAVLAGLGLIGKIIWDKELSREAELRRNDKVAKEHPLALEYSVPTVTSWRVRYPEYDENIIYRELDGENNVVTYKEKDVVNLRNKAGGRWNFLDDDAKTYVRLDNFSITGKNTTKLELLREKSGFLRSDEDLDELSDIKILSITDEEGFSRGIDTRAVEFLHGSGTLAYVDIRPTGRKTTDGSDKDIFEVRFLERVQRE